MRNGHCSPQYIGDDVMFVHVIVLDLHDRIIMHMHEGDDEQEMQIFRTAGDWKCLQFIRRIIVCIEYMLYFRIYE